MINSVKDLDDLLKTCRKYGVEEISVHGVALKFGAAPSKPEKKRGEKSLPTDIEDQPVINGPGDLSPEQLAMYSVTGMPG